MAATYEQVAYMVYDELKLGSDDSYFNIDHVLFLMNNYRALILKQRYSDIKKNIPLVNFQTICLKLETTQSCLYPDTVVSEKPVPQPLGIDNSITLNPVGDLFGNIEFTLVDDSRFPYVGNNKWLSKIIYFTIGSDTRLYLKSQTPDYKHIKKVQLSAIFDNPVEASKLSCDEQPCDYLGLDYPLEADLIPPLVQMVVQELRPPVTGVKEDDKNDAQDSMPDTNKPTYTPNPYNYRTR